MSDPRVERVAKEIYETVSRFQPEEWEELLKEEFEKDGSPGGHYDTIQEYRDTATWHVAQIDAAVKAERERAIYLLGSPIPAELECKKCSCGHIPERIFIEKITAAIRVGEPT